MKKLIIQILLAVVIIFLGFLCYQSISIPLEFVKIKNERYTATIQRLIDIRTAQDAYKGIHGVYTASFDSLIYFIKYDSVRTVRSIGALTDEDLENGVTEAQAIKEGKIIRDTVKVAALENIFTKDFAIDNIRYVPHTDKKHQFKMGATTLITDSGLNMPVFEARASNMIIFENIRDQYDEELLQENGERIRLNKYPGLKVGDIKEVNNNIGNWE